MIALGLVLATLASVTDQVCGQSDTKSPDPYFETPLTPALGEVRKESDDADKAKASPSGQEFSRGQVLAIVGGHPIYHGDMIYEISQIVERFMGPAPREMKQREARGLIPRLLPKYIDQKLMYVDAMRNLPEGAKIQDAIADAEDQFESLEMPNMIKKAGVKNSLEFDGHLRANGSSLRQMRRQWAQTQISRFLLRQNLNINPEVTHQELLDHYQEHRKDYFIPARVRWEQLVVRFNKFPTRMEAKKALVIMGNEVVGGASFAAVAKRSSHGFRASQGGRHDWTTKGSLAATSIDEALFDIPLDTLSDIIESDTGFHIVRVLERQNEGHVPFRDAQVEIREKIVEEKRNEILAKHVEKLRAEIPIEYLIDTPERQSENPETNQKR